jgi:uncharacterized protein YndB with AHSA1/START domain
MATPPSATTTSAERELLITRVLDAPPDLVFEAWTNPEHLVRWWGPAGFTTPSCTMDVRPGGSYRICMRAPDGTDHWVQGVYREIVAPQRLVCTWVWEDAEGRPGDETLLTVTFEEHGGKTRLTLHHGVFGTVEERDNHESGWTAILVRLAAYVTESEG